MDDALQYSIQAVTIGDNRKVNKPGLRDNIKVLIAHSFGE